MLEFHYSFEPITYYRAENIISGSNISRWTQKWEWGNAIINNKNLDEKYKWKKE